MLNLFFGSIRLLGLPLVFVTLFNFVLVGVLASYAGISQIYWLGSIVLLLLLFDGRRLVWSPDKIVYCAWLFYLAVSWVFFTSGIALKLVAIKDYLIPAISAFLAFRISLDEMQLISLYKLLRVVVFVQLPFVIHQFFVTARNSSHQDFDWDLISGTFGFNPEGGGGNSAGLLLFLCFFTTLSLTKLRISGRCKWDVAALGVCLVSVFMMETKVVLLLSVFIVVSLSKFRDLLKPKVVGGYLVVLPCILGLLLVNYNSNFSVDEKEGRSISEYVDDLFVSYFDEDVMDYETGEVSRQASYDLWLEHNVSDGMLIESFFGHGLTSSKFANSGISEAVSYSSYINFAGTQVTVYLWDVGVLGVALISFFMLLKVVYLLKVESSGVYVTAFNNGRFFLGLSFLLYAFYSDSVHVNSVTFTLFILFLIENSNGEKARYKGGV